MKVAVYVVLLVFLSSCTFVKNAAVQAEYARIQASDPSMLNLKHMIDRETFFVYGLVGQAPAAFPVSRFTVAAFSDRFQKHELVDVLHNVVPGTHYGLNLPPGHYDLIAFADVNGNGVYESDEAMGRLSLDLHEEKGVRKILGKVDIPIERPARIDWHVALGAQTARVREQSLFFPPDTIRELDDALFDADTATLGMYHPTAFLERAGTMFYALEEDIAYKIPVIFVHGIDGSARDFSAIVQKLDRTRFKPLFFYYPSGGDLNQMAVFFFEIFLSGKVLPIDENVPRIVVAHSMGGLVVREALNKLGGVSLPQTTFISLATPFGGMASAASGERNPLLVIPSWRNLNPDNAFIKDLYRTPFSKTVVHRLVYAYGNPGLLKVGDDSDGIVPLVSQLHPRARQQAAEQIGFNASHVGILRDAAALDYVLGQIAQVKTAYPDMHMASFLKGGFDQSLGAHYSKQEAYVLRYYGKYLRDLVQHNIQPMNTFHQHFLDVANHQKKPSTDAETAWLKFVADYPEVAAAGARTAQ